MKAIRFRLLAFLLLFATGAYAAPGPGEDNSSVPGIHAIGNGRLCVYGQGADILQIFGPPYSSPTMFCMNLCGDWETVSVREPRTAVWRHFLRSGSHAAVQHTDFISDSACAFVRRFSGKDTVRYRIGIRLEERYRPYDDSLTCRREDAAGAVAGANDVFRVGIRPGVPFYSSYPARSGYLYRIVATGSVRVEPVGDQGKELLLTAAPGDGMLYVIAAQNDGQLAERTARAASLSWKRMLKESEKTWRSYSDGQQPMRASRLGSGQRRRFRSAVDDVAVLIRSQQSSMGSVLAGLVYHMGYVRDQYGVSRALLALGHSEQARMILDFYYGVWKQFGLIHNAQAIGYPGIFHRHENDETEITGYLVVQAFDYYRRTGDVAFLRQIMPMLEWATEAQRRNLIDGMLPFNGDETYIAGGVVPRQVMYHGSAEATLLFIEGSRRLIDFVREHKLWDESRIASLEKEIADCSGRFREHFYRDGKLYVNNPSRERKVSYPATRPGVCLYPNHFDYFPETYHFKGSLYFCKDCIAKDNHGIEPPEPQLFSIPSAYLFPIYIDAQLFSDDEKRALLGEVVRLYERTGRISTQDRILGYDFGMFLYALCWADDPLAGPVYDRMMALRDGAGAWVEYYVDGHPSGCGCRPWESGINIEAAIRYAR